MIKSKADYVAYLEADRLSMGVGRGFKDHFLNDRWNYVRLLRRSEYLHNTRKFILLRLICEVRRRRLGRLLGYSIPLNVFGPGLAIPHRGDIVVNSYARIGANCRIHVGTNIGTQIGTLDEVPVIGNNCYIGPGAKLYGKIVIGDNVIVGANAVVNKSFPDGNCTVAGVPAKVISDKSTKGLFSQGYKSEGGLK